MKNKTYLIFFVLILSALFFPGYAEPAPAGEDEGILLTWQDMRKLLDLNDDKIKLTWKEFRQLLAQSGNRMDMNVRIEGGVVTIKRERFKQILNKMPPPVGKMPAAPKDYIVTEANYTGAAAKNNARFIVRFKIYVFEKQSPTYVPIPVLSAASAVSGITVDGEPGMMQIKSGWYNINLKKSGYHEVEAAFSVGKNKQSLSFPIARSIINTIDFTVPGKDFDINIESASSVRPAGGAAPSGVTAHLPPMNRVSINWSPKSKKRIKKPALFYAGTHTVISAAPDILKAATTIDLEILQSSLDTIAIRVPEQDEVVKVSGPSIKDWRVRETAVGRVLEIHPGFDITNRFQFTVNTERMLAADTLLAGYKGLQVLDARRETGAIGIVAQSAVEVNVKPSPGLEKLEFHQLPKKILAMSHRPILYSYKYARHPYYLDIAIHTHQQLEGISTVIESAVGTALFLPEGKMLFKIVYTVRNSYKQFMELELPGNAAIWTVMVDNKREKASRNKKGKVLIPLLRSSGSGDRLKSFNVQLIYTQPFEEFRLRGSSEYYFPKTDIFINKIRMEMYLPEGYSYDFDKGEWKEVLIERDISRPREAREDRGPLSSLGYIDSKPSASAPEPGKRDKVSIEKKKSERIEKEELSPAPTVADSTAKKKSKKVKRGILTGPAGLSSISVYLPISGRKYVFSKKIIGKNDSYPLKFSYFHRQTLHGIYLLSGILLLLALSFYIYKRFGNRVKGDG